MRVEGSGGEALRGEQQFDFTPENIAMIKEMAQRALMPGLQVEDDSGYRDYFDSLYPSN